MPKPSNITYYNYKKTEYKIVTYSKPYKLSEIYKINENRQGLDSTDIIDEDLGKEDP